MKKKGFTLVELLVVIAIIAMLLAILMPALGKVRQLAYRLMCGTNLKGLGTAMMVYSNDYDESYPRSGGSVSGNYWSEKLVGWKFDDTEATLSASTAVKGCTLTSTWFLLIKYADVSAAQFACQASDQKKYEFNPQNVTNSTTTTDITMLWDFGSTKDTTGLEQYKYVSYCMQNPFFSTGSVNASSQAGKPVAADRNPWIASADGKFITTPGTGANAPQLLVKGSGTGSIWETATADNKKGATSSAHQQEGQNVLFNDGHVSFEKTVVCGVETDNIYTYWSSTTVDSTGTYNQIGVAPKARHTSAPASAATAEVSRGESDSCLVL